MTAETSSDTPSTTSHDSYGLLFWTFLKIGSTAFGGFMALISVVQNYLVDREKLLSNEEMMDGVSLATILPGPIAVNVVAYAGYKIRGISGAFVCAFAVILPSFLLILGLSYAYFNWGDIPEVNNVFRGFLPAVAAVILAAAYNMGRKTLTGPKEALIAIAALSVIIFVGGFYSTLGIIVVSGILGFFIYRNKKTEYYKNVADYSHIDKVKSENETGARPVKNIVAGSLIILGLLAILIFNTNASANAELLATFSSMSLLLFGGGFVFIPLIQESVVGSLGWVTQKEFVDAIAMGQVTPGPILISATFIGYKVAGITGAAVATIGIFTPPAIVMLICTHYLEKIKSSDNIKAVLKAIRSAIIGMIVAASYVVIQTADHNVVSLLIFLASLFALIKLKLEVVWIIPVAGIIGFLFY